MNKSPSNKPPTLSNSKDETFIIDKSIKNKTIDNVTNEKIEVDKIESDIVLDVNDEYKIKKDRKFKEDYVMELETIKYKTMLLNQNKKNANTITAKTKPTIHKNKMDELLKINAKNKKTGINWSRIQKNEKKKCLIQYITLLREKNEIDEIGRAHV